jgi:ectoine hydroxylase-related dioxygenase (phytanoyl-CoA dioxygenase family)
VIKRPGFSTEGAVAVPMRPGDVLFHDILLVHASPASQVPALRRVVYYEFRTAHVESALGPHTPEYIPLKQRVLLDCVERRGEAAFARDEEPFRYAPPPPFGVEWTPGTRLPTHRYEHGRYWRAKG